MEPRKSGILAIYGLAVLAILLLSVKTLRTDFVRRDLHPSENVPSDLSSPSSAFAYCRNAFRKESEERLRHCLSHDRLTDYLTEGQGYVHLWQFGFSVCGGYGRMPVRIVESGEEAYIEFEPIEGCFDSIKMVREDEEWKFDETGRTIEAPVSDI